MPVQVANKYWTHAFRDIDGVVVILSQIDNCQDQISDDEILTVRTAAPIRVREFVAGRTLSRIALDLIGAEKTAIIASTRRHTYWSKDCSHIIDCGIWVKVELFPAVNSCLIFSNLIEIISRYSVKYISMY